MVFAVRGKTWAKSIRLTTAVDFGLLTTQTWLWWKCLKACILVHTHMSVAENASSVVCVFPAGVLLFDRSQGFWLSHSVPHFPSFPERGYLYPSSGKVNGQTALCVTYRYEQFPRIGEWPLMRQQGLTKSISVNILDVNLQNSLLAKTMTVFALLSGLT